MNLELVRIGERVERPIVSFSRKGTVRANKEAMELLGIDISEKVQFFRDVDDRQKWYIYVTPNGYLRLRRKSRTDFAGTMQSAYIAKKVIESFYHKGRKPLKFEVAKAVRHHGKDVHLLKIIKKSLVMDIPDPNSKL